MNIEEMKELLTLNNIEFEVCDFDNEKEYFLHNMLFPCLKNRELYKVKVVIIRSKNGKKNIELQFNDAGNTFRFEEMRFGDYCFEMFDYNEEMLAEDLLKNIKEIMYGKLSFISAYNLKKKCWLGDTCFDLEDDDDEFGEEGFIKAMKRISKPKSIFAKLMKTKIQYEIYDWNTYKIIVA